MNNIKKTIIIFAVTIIISLSIILGSYILGSLIKEGLEQIGIGINNGLRNMTF